MRVVRLVGAALVVAAALAAGASGATAPVPGTVVGAGSVSVYGFSVVVAAHGGPNGAIGVMSMISGGTHYDASVDCVLVYGNSALVVGTLRRPQGPATKLVAEFVDNGNGRHSPPDAVVAGIASAGPDACHPTLVDFSDAFPVDHGNFVVRAD